MNVKRIIRCLKCGEEFTLNLDTNLPTKEIIITGECPKCSSTIQINFTHFEKEVAVLNDGKMKEENTQIPNIFESPIDEIMHETNDNNQAEEEVESSGIIDIEEHFPTESTDALSEIMKDEEDQ